MVHKDQILLSWINASLSPSVCLHVVDASTAHGAWIALQQAFGAFYYTRFLHLHIQLKISKNMIELSWLFLKKSNIADELVIAGGPLQLEEFNAIICCNLGSDLPKIVAALSTRRQPVSCHKLLSILKSYNIGGFDSATDTSGISV